MARAAPILSVMAMATFCMENVALSAPFHSIKNLVPESENNLVLKVHNCHANTLYNYVPEIDNEARHRHGRNCTPIIIDSGGGFNNHCHANGQRHSHRGFGRTVHSHYGADCRVDVWNQHNGGNRGGACIQVGPLTFCK